MKDSPNFLYIHIILLIKSPSNFPIYRRDLPIFIHINLGGVLKIIPSKEERFLYLTNLDESRRDVSFSNEAHKKMCQGTV